MCDGGYFCKRKAITAKPNQGDTANVCPEGHYCPKNTGEPNRCPIGTLNNRKGKFNYFLFSILR